MKRASTAIFFISWIILAWFTPASSYWRDSGELIISGVFLDIAHPAGFPLYSQLAHLFSHLPFGPLAWRIHLFSTFLGAVCLTLTYVITRIILVRDLKVTGLSLQVVPLASVLIVALSKIFLLQSMFAEVYILNCVLIQILFLLIHTWYWKDDTRFLLGAAFVGGLSLGNHVSIALAYFLMLIPIFVYKRSVVRNIGSASLLFVLGCLVYLYIPVRAQTDPILNTGQPKTFSRFIKHISNERDWLIRSKTPGNTLEAAQVNFHLLGKDAFGEIKRDASKLVGETSILALFLAFLGIGVLFKEKRAFTALSLLAVGISNWMFFAGWQPDPWVPLVSVIAIAAALPIGLLQQSKLFNKLPLLKHVASLFLILFLIWGSFRPTIFHELSAIKEYETPRHHAKAMLRNVEPYSYYFTEPSQFLLYYLTHVEGYRDDVRVFYLLDLYYPELFNKRTYTRSDEALFTPMEGPLPHPPNVKNLGNFISFVKDDAPIETEPVTLLNYFLREVVYLTADGRVRLLPGKGTNIEKEFFDSAISEIQLLINHYYEMPRLLANDVASRIVLRAFLYADLYNALGMADRSVEVLEMLCTSSSLPTDELCSRSVKQNIRAYKALLNNKGNKENVGN